MGLSISVKTKICARVVRRYRLAHEVTNGATEPERRSARIRLDELGEVLTIMGAVRTPTDLVCKMQDVMSSMPPVPIFKSTGGNQDYLDWMTEATLRLRSVIEWDD